MLHKVIQQDFVKSTESGRFADKSFRLQVDSPTLKSIRLHDLRCFAYTVVDSPTLSDMSHYIEAYY